VTGPGFYRKRPVPIEAYRFDGANADDIVCWVKHTQSDDPRYRTDAAIDTDGQLIISTLEGDHLASPGDWIICGTKGEHYPCKQSIFEGSYEPVGEEQ
jgi:hypothetical protein